MIVKVDFEDAQDMLASRLGEKKGDPQRSEGLTKLFPVKCGIM